jgi:hypothetical protein
MEAVHRLLELTREQVGKAGFGVLQDGEDTPLVIPGWPAEDIIDDLFPITGMVDANA